MKKNKKIVLVGAGGHGVSSADVIETENKYKIYGFVDKKKKIYLKKYKIIGSDKDLAQIRKTTNNALVVVGQIKDLFLSIFCIFFLSPRHCVSNTRQFLYTIKFCKLFPFIYLTIS